MIRIKLIWPIALGVSLIISTLSASADMREPLNTALIPATQLPSNLHQVNVNQSLGNQVPLDLEFNDELGNPIRLSDIIRDKPVLLTLNYFKCPGLCTLVLNGVVDATREIPLVLGKDFQILTVSINPKEGAQLARAKKRSYLARYGIAAVRDDAPGWRMLTGTEGSIRKLADSVGFHYFYDAEHDEYAHPSVIMVLTPEGRVSQYLFGIQYPPQELSQALKRAASADIGSKVSAILLYCFHYDPLSGKWTPKIMNILRILGGAIAVTIVAFLGFSLWKEQVA